MGKGYKGIMVKKKEVSFGSIIGGKIEIEKGKTFGLLMQPNRLKILKLCSKKEFNISELKELLGIKYKSTWEHVRKLEKFGYVKTREEINKKGKNVFVYVPKGKKQDKMKNEIKALTKEFFELSNL